MRRLLRFWKDENGQYAAMFAVVLVVIVFFVGIAIDLNMVYRQRNAMETTLQIVRDNRFTYQDSIRYADNPAAEMYKIISQTMAANGYGEETEIKLYFKEEPPQQHYRYYTVRTEVSQPFYWNFLRIFGAESTMITVNLDGGSSYGDGAIENVWCPVDPPSTYNGCYIGKVGTGYASYTGELPSGW